jgi:hypothetical protein
MSQPVRVGSGIVYIDIDVYCDFVSLVSSDKRSGREATASSGADGQNF